MKTCECCGHPLPENEVANSLTPMQRKLYQALLRSGKRGIPSREVMDRVYADDPSGGPESPNIVHVMRWQLNKRLKMHGLKIISSPRGHGAIWRLDVQT